MSNVKANTKATFSVKFTGEDSGSKNTWFHNLTSASHAGCSTAESAVDKGLSLEDDTLKVGIEGTFELDRDWDPEFIALANKGLDALLALSSMNERSLSVVCAMAEKLGTLYLQNKHIRQMAEIEEKTSTEV